MMLTHEGDSQSAAMAGAECDGEAWLRPGPTHRHRLNLKRIIYILAAPLKRVSALTKAAETETRHHRKTESDACSALRRPKPHKTS